MAQDPVLCVLLLAPTSVTMVAAVSAVKISCRYVSSDVIGQYCLAR